MKVFISNNIRIYNATPELIQWCEENLIVTNPKWQTLKRIHKEIQIQRYHISQKMDLYVQKGNDLILPFGVLYSIWGFIKNSEIELEFNKTNDISIKDKPISQPLYDYQEEAVNAMVKAKGGILVGGCGSGKTNCGIEIIHRIGKKFLFLVHTGDLLRQAKKRFLSLYPDLKIGTITEGKVDLGEDGCISTVQTLSKIDKSIYENEFEIVMLDEAHHTVGSPTLNGMFKKVVSNIPARYKYGLTATPNREDGLIKSMYTILGVNPQGEFKPTFKIDKNKINTLVATHEKVELDTEMSFDFLMTDGTFNYNQLIDFLSNNDARNEKIINNVIELNKQNRKQLILCHRVAHCEMLNKALLSNGIKSEILTGKVTAKNRNKVLNEQTEWNCIVATYSLAKEGLDLPCLDTLHLTTPQKNKALVVQSVGRIERIMEGKQDPIVFDYVDVNIPYCLAAYKKRRGQLKRRF